MTTDIPGFLLLWQRVSHDAWYHRGLMCSSSHAAYPQRVCDSPNSEEADYATESDMEQSHDQNTSTWPQFVTHYHSDLTGL
ncbi:hypothetical protein DPMN_056903 [Dreissena polymorpha]|uniref:Uncharacterized protein n=1 Tax=Dreissena polymorpha TaxID=45954 RepID=A0A9D4CUC0_DREPO|nr:hypothetical protein DPMN_056903 [Dreissena polymorpha]